MNKPTFTQGPWIVKRDRRGYPYIGVKSDPWTYQGTVATVEQEKDARLIASAPELFAQCKFLEKVLTELKGEYYDEWAIDERDKLRELLAKVEGEK